MDSNQRMERAKQARALLKDPIFIEVFDGLHDSALAIIESSPMNSQGAAFTLHSLAILKGAIQSIIDDEKMATRHSPSATV